MGEDGGYVLGSHVLGGIEAEAGDAQVDEVVEVGGDFCLDFGLARVEVGQIEELAAAHLCRILIVGNVVIGGETTVVKVVRAVKAGIVIVGEVGAGGAYAAFDAGHVVDYGVDVDIDAGGATTADHLGKLGAGAAATFEVVADGLIALPPGMGFDDEMFLRGRDLDGDVAGRAQKALTFLGNVRPGPLEEMDHDGARGGGGRRGGGG